MFFEDDNQWYLFRTLELVKLITWPAVLKSFKESIGSLGLKSIVKEDCDYDGIYSDRKGM